MKIRLVLTRFLFSILAASSIVIAQTKTFTTEDLLRLKIVVDAAISPDGSKIAYTLAVPRNPFQEEDGRSWVELHLVDAAGHSRAFITGKVNVSEIAWTPDGRHVSFLEKRDGDETRSLYVIPVDGGEARKRLSHETDIRSYSWSPGGERVAFTATEKKSEQKSELEEKGFDQEIFEEDWQPVKVWVADLEETSKPRALDLPGSASTLLWSPVDDRLVVVLAPTPLVDDFYVNRKIHVVDVRTGDILARIDNPGKLGEISWSPDGETLAVISAEDAHDPREGRLMTVSSSGGELQNLLPDYEGHVRSIAWRDADTIVYLGDRGVWTTAGRMNRNGSGHEVLVDTGQGVYSNLSLSADSSKGVVLAESPTHPSEVFLLASEREEPRRLTHSNPWLDEKTFASQEVIRFRARDGLRLEGILIRPVDAEPGRRVPLILTVHGGPESHYSNGWLTYYSLPGQIAAAKGFAVFYPNYRGSTGRGVEFSKLSQGDPAGDEFDDLVDAVNHLVEMGLVDSSKVGITGGSYGGYASAWGATNLSDHFAASVMFVGLSDLISKYGTTDIPEEMYLVHYRKKLAGNWDFFLERSPVYYSKDAHTPILILHGKEDTRVHPGQSMELYRNLKLFGKAPVRLVFYRGEGHGNRRAASRLDYNIRMMRWMEHYLMGPGGAPPAYPVEYEKWITVETKEASPQKGDH